MQEFNTAETPKTVSRQEWEAAHQRMLVKEKALIRARDALTAECRRMPWLAVEKAYTFDGSGGKASLLDLFDGRRQLIVYRIFFEPAVSGWPERVLPRQRRDGRASGPHGPFECPRYYPCVCIAGAAA